METDIGKTAEAVGETAKAAAEITRESRLLMFDLLSPAAQEIGEWAGEEIARFRQRRAENFQRLSAKAKCLLVEAGRAAKPVEPKILRPIVEDGSMEEDASLASKWAGLLATASTDDLHPRLVDTMRLISRADARVLDVLDERQGWDCPEAKQVRVAAGVEESDFVMVLENLCTLGLIARGYKDSPPRDPYAYAAPDNEPVDALQKDYADTSTIHSAKTLRLTPFGDAFLRACKGPQKEDGG